MCDQVPPELVVNVDERVLNMVPVSECSCEKESATQVPVAAIDVNAKLRASWLSHWTKVCYHLNESMRDQQINATHEEFSF